MNERYISVLLLLVSVVFGEDTNKCKNGGFPKSDGTCNCHVYWDGETCDELKCANGGYVSNGVCFCPPGYHGVHCEATLTLAAPLNGFETERSFNMFIFNPVSVYYGGMALRGLRDAISSDSNIKDGFYKKFTLQIGNDEETETDSEEFGDHSSFLQAINKELIMNLQPRTYSCYEIKLYSRLIKQIKKNHLMHTVLTVFTQHPGQAENEEYEELLQIAMSFGIQINILFSHDKYMIECELEDDVFKKMRELCEKSGGNFVVLNRDNPGPMASKFVALHADQQKVRFAKSSDCKSGLSLSDVKLDKVMRMYTIVINSENEGTVECKSGTSCFYFSIDKVDTGDSEIKLYTFAGYDHNSPYQFDVTTNGPCEIKLISNRLVGSSPNGLKLFYSFVESDKLDTSNAFLVEGAELLTSLHLEFAPDAYAAEYENLSLELSNFSLMTENESHSSGIKKRERSSLEFITEETFKCDSNKKYWLELEIAGVQNTETIMTLQRYIPVNCYSHSTKAMATTESDSNFSTTEVAEGAEVTTEEAQTNNTEAPEQCRIFSHSSQPTLLVAYSNGLNQTQFKQFASAFRDSAQSIISNYYQNYGSLLFDAEKEAQEGWKIYDKIGELNNVLSVKVPDQKDGEETNIKEFLQAALDLEAVQDRSTILISAARFCNESVDPKVIAQLTSRQIRVIVLFEYSLYEKKARSNKFYEDLAAVTNGHYIVMNELSKEKGGSVDAIVLTVTQELIMNAVSQDLVLAKSYISSGGEDKIGVVDFSGLSSDQIIPLHLTVSMGFCENQLDPLPPSVVLYAKFKKADDGSFIALEYTRNMEANIWSQSLQLNGSSKYEVSIMYTGMPNRPIATRLWRLKNNDTLEYKFVGSSNAKIGQDLDYPDADEGAVMRATYHAGQDSEDLTGLEIQVEYTDCEGNDATAIKAKLSEGDHCVDAYFVPFFCEHKLDKNDSCSRLTEEMTNVYNVKVSLSNSAGVFRQYHSSIYCAESAKPECDHHMMKKEDGTCDCVTHNATTDSGYYTGPICQLDDCNGNGLLEYINDTIYKCNCREGFRGEFCEEGYCPTPNEEPGTTDGYYRTLTVVVDVSENVNTALIKNVFSQESVNKTIWLFHLVAYNNETEVSIYLGRDIDEFTKSFDHIKGNLPSYSGNHSIPSPQTLRHALQPSASDVRGVLFVFVNTSSSLEMPDDVLEYYRALHPYTKLQVYFAMNLNKTEMDPSAFVNLAELTEATGGALLDLDEKLLTKFVDDTVQNQVTVNEIGKLADESSFTVEGQAFVLITATNPSATVDIFPQNDVVPVNSSKTDPAFTHAYAVESDVISDYTVTIHGCVDDCEARISVMAINGFTPAVNFVEYLNEDTMTALPVNTSLPKIILHGNDNYGIDDYSDVNVVYPNRSCTFEVTDEVKTVDGSLGDIQKVGGKQIKLKLSTVDASTEVYIQKIVPYIVSDGTECINSDYDLVKDVKCKCHDGYEGPDCRRIRCENGGRPNAFKTACICNSLLYYGEHCEKQNGV